MIKRPCETLNQKQFDKLSKTEQNMFEEKNTLNKLCSVNIHQLLSNESYKQCFQVIKDSKKDKRLKKLNAKVMLHLKNKGKRNTLTRVTNLKKYKKLVDFAFKKKARFGFDSCGANAFTKAIKDRKDFKQLEIMVESCESTAFSLYISCDAIAYPCSFTEGEDGFKGVDVLKAKAFVRDVWMAKEVIDFRNKLIEDKDCNGCRKCQAFDLEVK